MTTIQTNPSQTAAVAVGATQADADSAAVSALPDLPSPTVGFADPVAAALAALDKMLKGARDYENSVRHALRKDQIAAEKASVKDLHEKANAIRSAAWVSAACDAAAAASTALDALGGGTTKSVTSIEDRTTKMTVETTRTSWESIVGGNASKIALEASNTVHQFGEAAATCHEADSKAADAQADGIKSEMDDAKDRAKDLGELTQKVYDTIKSIQESKQAAAMAILQQRS